MTGYFGKRLASPLGAAYTLSNCPRYVLTTMRHDVVPRSWEKHGCYFTDSLVNQLLLASLPMFMNDSGAGSLQYGSTAGGSSIVHCGKVKEEQWDELYDKLVDALKIAIKRHGDERTAAYGQQGHQKTPTMIAALLLDAKDMLGVTGPQESPSHLPRGGFTDVGLHTGGRPRETAWPLACEMFKVGPLPEKNNANGYLVSMRLSSPRTFETSCSIL